MLLRGFHTCPSGCCFQQQELVSRVRDGKEGLGPIDPGSAAGLDASISKAADRNQTGLATWNPTSIVKNIANDA